LNQFYANDPKGGESEGVIAIQKLITMIKNLLTSPGIDLIVPNISQDVEANSILGGAPQDPTQPGVENAEGVAV
jgi:hypothetical protein